MEEDPAVFRRDFDRIAALPEPRWHSDDRHVARLLRRLPEPCARALDVGCGTGRITRCLAARCREVIGIDPAPEMVRVARERAAALGNVRFECTGLEEFDAPPGSFDAVVAVLVLHHVPLRPSLARLRELLAPGGVLLVLELDAQRGARRLVQEPIAYAVSGVRRLVHTGRWRLPRAARAAWRAHAAHDPLPHFAAMSEVVRELLPGAVVRRHLAWRCSVVWRKPAPAAG